jgi:hypothetical protein
MLLAFVGRELRVPSVARAPSVQGRLKLTRVAVVKFSEVSELVQLS